MTDDDYKACTAKIKALADVRKLALDDTDSIIRAYYKNLKSDVEIPLVEGLTAEEKKHLEKEEQKLKAEAERSPHDSIVA